MKKIIARFSSFSVLTLLFFAAPHAYAATHITAESVFQPGTEWLQAFSPYILDDSISIPSGDSLYIGPGVTVTASSTPDQPISISVGGDFTVAGTDAEPVTISGLDNIGFSHSNISIAHARISMPSGMNIFYSTTTIASSTMGGADDTAINVWGSSLDIKDSIISDNDYGIYSHSLSTGVFLSFLKNVFNIFGTSALADTIVDPKQNRISVSGSSISGNRKYGIYNVTTNTVNAQNNWWGDPAGPRLAEATGTGAGSAGSLSVGDAVYGLIDVSPWLAENPASSTPLAIGSAPACCSNVLFLPGIEGSRLYVDERGGFGAPLGTSTLRLWEPLQNSDVGKLFMNNSGVSINSSIYTKDVIDSAYSVGVYGNLIAMMNGIVADRTINAWEPFAYDWRYGADSIFKNAANGTSTSKLLLDFESLASSSQTGKVSIVAHSDGGLVAKILAKALADKGESNLIDKVVMVAVPQLGTPQAVASILHGDGQDILGGLILSDDTARQLGENSPGAYGLLPSQDYFNSSLLSVRPFQPVISFTASVLADPGFHLAGDSQSVSTYNALRNFLAGISDHRSQPAVSDVAMPGVLHAPMLDSAQSVHNTIDDFSFGSSSAISFLVGVGEQTLTGLRYSENISCPATNNYPLVYRPQPCTDSLQHTSSTTPFGDGTVVDVSAETSANISKNNAKNYYFNLFADSKGKLLGESHATILNTDSGVAFVKEQITSTTAPAQSLPPNITDTEPTLADFPEDNLVVTMHSPVEINLYDNQGRHTGPIPNPGSDLGRYETNIPDSTYKVSDSEGTSITVPYGTDYRVVLNGIGSGYFTLDTEHDKNWTAVSQTEFSDMPASPLLKAELFLATTTYADATSTSGPTAGKMVSVATTSQLLVMDFDGDGITDATSTPGQLIDPTAYLRSMERTIQSFHLSPYRQKVMCDKIEKIIGYMLAKKRIPTDDTSTAIAQAAMKDLDNKHWIFKNLDQVQKDRMTAMFQAIIDSADI